MSLTIACMRFTIEARIQELTLEKEESCSKS